MALSVTHNLDQCLSELTAEAAKLEQKEIEGISKAAMKTMRKMMFTDAPVLTGFYRSSFDLGVNEVSKFRRRRPKGMTRQQHTTGKMVAQAQDQMAKAAQRLGTIKRLADLHFISITNNAPHVNFVEWGTSRNRARMVFQKGEQAAKTNLDAIGQEIN